MAILGFRDQSFLMKRTWNWTLSWCRVTQSPWHLWYQQTTITNSICSTRTCQEPVPQKGRCLPMSSGQYCFWELRNLVCIQLTNYAANYTLGKLNLGAKDFIKSIATNIVLGYKLPGSLDPVTFYFDLSNRFIICSGKKSSFS